MEIYKMYDGKLGERGFQRSLESFIWELIIKIEQSMVRCRKIGGYFGRGNYMLSFKRCDRD